MIVFDLGVIYIFYTHFCLMDFTVNLISIYIFYHYYYLILAGGNHK